MPYTVQIRLDGDSVRRSVEKLWRWIDRERIEPPVFRYRMTTTDVALRLDFRRLSDAAAFADAFHGAILELARAE